jgi:hypothetical protein
VLLFCYVTNKNYNGIFALFSGLLLPCVCCAESGKKEGHFENVKFYKDFEKWNIQRELMTICITSGTIGIFNFSRTIV